MGPCVSFLIVLLQNPIPDIYTNIVKKNVEVDKSSAHSSCNTNEFCNLNFFLPNSDVLFFLT